jgi:hypothetical protein
MKNYLFVFIILLSLIFAELIIAQTRPIEWRYGKSVKIPATEQYTSTGIWLTQGDTIMIKLEGVAKFDPSQPYVGWQGPSGEGNTIGCPSCPSSTAPVWSAIGKIGNSTPFYIGERILISADISGELFIGVNDEIISDNDGYFVAFIMGQKSIVTSVDDESSDDNIRDYKLHQNYPNPFNPATNISYNIPSQSFVSIKVYDLLGNEIATLVNEEKSAGNFQVEFNATGLSSGIYFYKFQSGPFVEFKKMVLIK